MPEPRRVLVVDDEPLARQRVVRLLARSGTFEVRAAADGVEALELCSAFRPELVFLDVQMPGLTGLELLARLPERRFRVIFQTAFDEHAVAAFEEEAVDYLVKPFTEERFRAALERALARIGDEERWRALAARLAAREASPAKLAVRAGPRILLVEPRDVLAFASREHVTCALLADGREGWVDLSLDALEERLARDGFVRLHRASLVNPAAVRAIRGGPFGLVVTLANGLELPVSRRRRPEAIRLVESVSRA